MGYLFDTSCAGSLGRAKKSPMVICERNYMQWNLRFVRCVKLEIISTIKQKIARMLRSSNSSGSKKSSAAVLLNAHFRAGPKPCEKRRKNTCTMEETIVPRVFKSRGPQDFLVAWGG